MQEQEAYQWLIRSRWRKRVVLAMRLPMTAKQLARRLDHDRDECSELLAELALHRMVRCLNPEAQRSRVFWLTSLGIACQKRLSEAAYLPWVAPKIPLIDWSLYGWVCFSHRSAIVRALSRPMQPAEIKRRAKMSYPDLRMSANNVRDAMGLLLAKGIVSPVRIRGQRHLRYELSGIGQVLRELLVQVGG
jgi:hypothetical protein